MSDIQCDEPKLRKKVCQRSDTVQRVEAGKFYEDQNKQTEAERRLSRIIEVKQFQNFIKAIMIKQGTQLLNQKYPLNVLELGFGKGGDLQKWNQQRIGIIYGVDISGSSLQEAINRYNSFPENKKDFYLWLQQTSADSSTLSREITEGLNFDIVSMQFMANLLYSSESSVDRFFINVTSRLCKNGIVIMTITDANVLVHKIREYGRKTQSGQWIMGNEHYSIIFDRIDFRGSPYGIEYNFYLEDSVGEKNKETGEIRYVPEYLIEMKEFTKKTAEFGLEIVENLNFTEVYHKNKDKPECIQMLKKILKINDEKWEMKKEHWEISHLYRYVVLRNKRGPESFRTKRKRDFKDRERTRLELHPQMN